ncbi:MAG: HIT family protein [Candidatus Nanoarchaeia archaeon]
MAEEESYMENMTPEQAAQLQRENCIFCKIVAGEIPSKKVYEDQDFIGILDINPASDGHVLLLPKQHYQIMPQIPPELVGSLGVACAAISAKILKGFKCEGTSVFIANGAVAGQRAPHFMVHIIPRTDGDDIFLNPALNDMEDDVFEETKIKLLSSMRPSGATPKRVPNKEKIPEEEQEEAEEEPEEPDIENDEEEEEQENEEDKKKSSRKKPAQKKQAPKKGPEKTPPQKKDKDGIDYDKLGRLFG